MKYLYLVLFIFGLLSCTNQKSGGQHMSKNVKVSKSKHGDVGAQEVSLYTLSNQNGIEVRISEYGGIITHLFTPDKNGEIDDIVLGFDSLDDYLKGHPYFGSVIGRYANRIAGGKFSLDGVEYKLAQNNGGNTLHGGVKGFDKYIWKSEIIKDGISLTRTSPDMEEGFPGKMELEVRYTLDNENQLAIYYKATTDKKTIVNLTYHSYFNLNGAGSGDVLDHEIMIDADYITPVSETMTPTGEIMSVTNTPFDFRASRSIGERINQGHPQIKLGNGYDHNFIRNGGKGMREVATAYDPASGRKLSVISSEPGVQLYTANFVDNIGKNNKKYDRRSAVCIETQHYPDSPNQPTFPSTTLSPGEVYESYTTYKFGVE